MKRATCLLLIFCPSALVADQAKQKTVAKFPREIKGDRAHYPGSGAFCPGSLSRKVPCRLWFSSHYSCAGDALEMRFLKTCTILRSIPFHPAHGRETHETNCDEMGCNPTNCDERNAQTGSIMCPVGRPGGIKPADSAVKASVHFSGRPIG